MKSKPLNAGDLRHRVTLLRNSPTTNEGGQQIANYQVVGTFYGLVEGIRAFEIANAEQYKGLNLFRVTLRAASGPILPTDQLIFNGLTLNVVGAVTDPFGVFIQIDATSKGPQ